MERLRAQIPLLAVIFLSFLPALAGASAVVEVPESDRLVRAPEAAFIEDVDAELERARALIDEKRYDEAAGALANIVAFDEDQLESAEELFGIIRAARTEYLEKGNEVVAELDQLLSAEIAPEDVVPTALRAYELIDEMRAILPYPNPNELALQADLQSRILLTIDQQRFNQIMEAALVQLREENYAEAVRIYVEGLDDYGFQIEPDASATADGEETEAERIARQQREERIARQLNETNGISLQIESFNPDDYPFTGGAFAQARDALEAASVGEPGTAIGESFVSVSDSVRSATLELTASLEAGDFDAAEAQIDSFLPLLASISGIYREVQNQSEMISNQLQLDDQRLVASEDARRSYHILFVAQLAFGRSNSSEPEGIVYAIESVFDLAANGPVESALGYADSRYELVRQEVGSFDWEAARPPGSDTAVASHVSTLEEDFGVVADAYRTALLFLDVSRDAGLPLAAADSPDPQAAYGGIDELIAALDALPEPTGAQALVPGVFRIASSDYFTTIAGLALQGYDTGLPLASTTNVALLNRQRTSLQDIHDEMIAVRDNWDLFVSESGIPQARVGNVEEGTPYADRLVSLLEQYELDVAVQTAQIDTTAAERSLAGHRSTVARARRALEEENASGIARPRTDTARRLLQPLVGTVSGIRVISSASGDLTELAEEGTSLATRLQNEVHYVRSDGTIQSLASRATLVATSVTAPATGLLPEARGLLEQALEQIDRAEALADEADQRVTQARSLLEQASADANAGDIPSASSVLGDVEDLLQNDQRSASRLISQSLQNWYRPQIESQWQTDQEELLAVRQLILTSIVLVRVDTLIDEAATLLDPTLDDTQPRPALARLDLAAGLWEDISPTLNPEIESLRRRAELQLLGSSRELDETSPSYTSLSQALNQALRAYANADYETATASLTNFLIQQPNNVQGRRLQVSIALAESAQSGQSADTIIRNFVTRVLDDASLDTPNDSATVRQYLQNPASRLANSPQYNTTDFFELATTLQALLDTIRADGIQASSIVQRDIQILIEQTQTKLNPDDGPGGDGEVSRPAAERAQALVDQYSNFDFDRATVAQLDQVIADMNEAIGLDDTNDEAKRIRLIAISRRPQQRPDPATQAVMDEAIALQQRREILQATALLERYEENNSQLVENIKDFNDLLESLQEQARRL